MATHVRQPVIVCESHPGHAGAITELLLEQGFDVHHAVDDETLIEAAATHRPHAVVYVLAHDLAVDLALLQLVRKVLPRVPLVLVCGAQDVKELRVAPVHPVHVAHAPLDPRALGEAVRHAIETHASHRVKSAHANAHAAPVARGRDPETESSDEDHHRTVGAHHPATARKTRRRNG